MKFEKKMTFRYIVAASLLISLDRGNGGGSIGGTPPSVEASKNELMMLQERSTKGDLIRFTEPGYDPVYLRPDIGSIKEHSLSSVALDSGNTTVFHTPSDTETIQAAFGRNLARSLHTSMPGVLPLLSDDLTFKVKPKIETVPVSELNQELLMRIAAPLTE